MSRSPESAMPSYSSQSQSFVRLPTWVLVGLLFFSSWFPDFTVNVFAGRAQPQQHLHTLFIDRMNLALVNDAPCNDLLSVGYGSVVGIAGIARRSTNGM